MRTEDGNIVQECIDGELGAFGVLVDKYKEGIYAFAYNKLRDFQDAQDVTQEVFLQAYRGLHSLRRWESFGFWLYRIASTRCKLRIRTQSRRVDQDFIADQDSKVLEDFSTDLHSDSQVSESIREALDSMPEIYREVLMLYYFGDMNSKEIARAIGVSPGAVRMRLSRARAQLKEEMIAMMSTGFEEQRLQAGFTFRIVEMVKRIKINPMPRTAALPWGLSLAAGIIIAVMSLGSHPIIPSPMVVPASSPLPREAKALRTGEIHVDILKASQIPALASMQGKGDAGDPQNALSLAPRAAGGTWANKAGMPTSRGWISASMVNGKIYVIGGTPPWVEMLSTVEEYDPATDKWTEKANILTKKCGVSAAVVNGKIYAIGGQTDHKFFATVEEYDPVKDEWIQKADMPTPRSALGTAVIDGKIYAIGGWNGPEDFSTVEVYDPAMDEWTERTPMPTARDSLGVGVVNGKIYAIGGWMPGITPVVEEYDPVADKWTKKSDMPTARWALSASVINGKIYAIGGMAGGPGQPPGINLATVEVYDPATDTWTKEANMSTARRGLSTSVVNGKIYAIGGVIAPPGFIDPSTSIVEEYTPEDWQISVAPHGKLPTTWGAVKGRGDIETR